VTGTLSELEVDAGCRAEMLWRCDAPAEQVESIVSALVGVGVLSRSPLSIDRLLYFLDHPHQPPRAWVRCHAVDHRVDNCGRFRDRQATTRPCACTRPNEC
jgi:hypothetical protein